MHARWTGLKTRDSRRLPPSQWESGAMTIVDILFQMSAWIPLTLRRRRGSSRRSDSLDRQSASNSRHHELLDDHEQRWSAGHRDWHGNRSGGRTRCARRGLPRRAPGAAGNLPQTTLLLREYPTDGSFRERSGSQGDNLACSQNQKDSADLSSDLLEGENITGLGLDAWESEEWLAGAERWERSYVI